ncbi:Sphingosine kinase 2 [Ananas comosus]|uniref:sphingosine kinase n=1 Tax=Ananas comosus TaxID=4615 RepID=A0A199UYV7_ANACO|nr:Sphingosine kinase 2 [Ananas comosus]
MVKDETLTLTLTESVRVNGSPAVASLGADGTLRWRSEGGAGERCVTLEKEVLGLEAEGRTITVKAFGAAEAKVVSCCGGGGSGGVGRARRDYVLEMPSDESAARWSARLSDRINLLDRPKRLFIIVNPFGGKRCGRKIFQTEVMPLLEAAGILFTMQETKYQLHAQEIAHSLDLMKYDGIVCVSGDGVLVEVVNGLLQREDWDTAIKVPLGIIPAGTGNGMAKSLLHSVGDLYSVPNAVFAIIQGHKRSLDVASVVQGGTKFFSVLMLTWGLIADIDIESEKYRWMGSARLDFYSLLRIMNLRKYSGLVQFVPAPGYEGYGEPIKQIDYHKDETTCSQEGQESNVEAQTQGYPGPQIDFQTTEWRALDGPFISVWINNVPWASENVMPAPDAKFSDGYLDAVIIRDCPKSALLDLMLKISDGSYVKSPYVMYLKVKAFRLEPGRRVGNPDKGGIVDSDGEVIARGDRFHDRSQHENLMAYGPPIQMTVDRGLATIFSPAR